MWYKIFIYNINNSILENVQLYLKMIICQITVIWYKIFPSNTNNLHTVIYYVFKLTAHCDC